MIADDLGIFFDADDFAVMVLRQRPGSPDITFSAVLGEQDQEVLDGRSLAPERVLAFASTADVRRGDLVVIDTISYRISKAIRVNDGAESRATLQKV